MKSWLIVLALVLAAPALAACQQVANAVCAVVVCPIEGIHVDPAAAPVADKPSE